MKITRIAWTAAAVLATSFEPRLLAMTGPTARAEDTAPMDHAAMASRYQQEAEAAQAKVASHELMLSRYEKMPGLPKGTPTAREQMIKHCRSLVEAYKEAAMQARDLAKMHGELAQGAR